MGEAGEGILREKVIEIQDLIIQFPTENETQTAVSNLSLTLHRGEVVGLVGESGSGKSITALSVMRLLPPSAVVAGGTIHFHSFGSPKTDLLRLTGSEMVKYRGSRLGMIFQEPMTSLNPVYRCGDQIAEVVRRHQGLDRAQARREAKAWLQRMQIDAVERVYRSYPHQLSGGQKQRVMIAMALSGNPDVLIADEPTTALDVTVQRSILELIESLRAHWQGAVLFITHDLGVMAQVADRVLVMRQGRVVEEGSIAEIFHSPRHPYTMGLLACRPPLHRRLHRLPVLEDFLTETGEATRASEAAIETFLSGLEMEEEEVGGRLRQLQAQDPFLSVRGLRTWFPSNRNFWGRPTEFTKAVENVNFEIFPGETLGLVGESGSGKTTLGRSLLRLIEPTEGAIEYRGRNVLELPESDWKVLQQQWQMIFQDPYGSLNPRMPVGEAILEPMRVYGMYHNEKERKERVMELLTMVQMSEDHFRRYPHEFSGGQRQRLCIARALALNPRFLICDESVSALDVSVQAQVLNLLIELRKNLQLTYLFISHDLSVVRLMSDRIMVMRNGQIEEIGPAEEVFRNPRSKYTIQLVESIPGGL